MRPWHWDSKYSWQPVRLRMGHPCKECKAIAEKARDQSGVFFVVDTLEFLHRGGRIGGAARLLGTALNLKPILTVDGRKN